MPEESEQLEKPAVARSDTAEIQPKTTASLLDAAQPGRIPVVSLVLNHRQIAANRGDAFGIGSVTSEDLRH